MKEQQKSPLLAVNKLFKRYASVAAVADTSFVLHRGEMVALIGVNGAGKSTLMAMCAGVLAPDRGVVAYGEGVKVSAGIGYLPEVPAVWESLSVEEFLLHVGRMQRVKDVKNCVLALVKKLWLEDVFYRGVEELSKGIKQRVFLAATLLANPQVLILDEPSDGLDPVQKDKILTFLQELAKERAVFISTHQLHDVPTYFNRVLMMDGGKLKLDTTPQELQRHGKGDIGLAFRVLTTNKGQGVRL